MPKKKIWEENFYLIFGKYEVTNKLRIDTNYIRSNEYITNGYESIFNTRIGLK